MNDNLDSGKNCREAERGVEKGEGWSSDGEDKAYECNWGEC